MTPPPLLLHHAKHGKFAEQISSAEMPKYKKRGGGVKTIITSFLISIFFQGFLFAFECPKNPESGALAVGTALDCPWAGA